MRSGERDFLRRFLIAVALVALVYVAWSLVHILLLVLGAVLLAIILKAIADPLCRLLHIPAPAGLVIAVLGVLGTIALAGWLFGAEIGAQTRQLVQTVPEAWRNFEETWERTVLGNRIQEWLAQASPEGSSVLAGAGRFLVSFGNAVTGIIIVFAGGIYMAADPDVYRRGLLKLFPASQRERMEQAFDDVAYALRRWLLGQLISMAVIGVLTGIGLAIIGLPSALALGLLAGVAAFVPVVGAVLAAIPALLTATTVSGTAVLLTLVVYVGVQQLEENVVMPLVQRRVVALPPALLLFAILAAALLFGALGVLLAAPLTVVIFVLVKRLYVSEALHTETDLPGEEEAAHRTA